MMNPDLTENQNEGFRFPVSNYFSKLPEHLERTIPTFDKSLDLWFDRNFDSVIAEWGLLTESELHRLERRLETVTSEIGSLYSGKTLLEEQIASLEILISSLETEQ